MRQFLKRLTRRGATMVEYAILIAVVGVGCVVAFGAIKTAISNQATSVSTTVAG